MKLKTLMMTVGVSALIAGGAIAQDTSTSTDTTTGAATTTTDMNAAAAPEFTSISEMTVGDLVGQSVYTPTGDTIGDVDYVIDQGNGAEAIVGVGGFLGLGEHSVALPLEQFKYDTAQKMVTLDTTKDALKKQPEFDESGVESLPDETKLADLMQSDQKATDAAKSSDSTTSDTGASSSDTGTTGSDTGASSSDTGTTGSDTGASSSDTGTTGSDTGASSSDTGTTGSDTGASSSDTGTTGSDTGASSSDSDTTQSDDTTKKSE